MAEFFNGPLCWLHSIERPRMDAASQITIKRYGRRFWEVRDANGELICICVYKKWALEVARRLSVPSPLILQDAPNSPAISREPVRERSEAAGQG